jgi:(p)ppGpp synthase/HD superfamily hydrolase
VVEHGGDEDQAIAALLHDAAEDQGDRRRWMASSAASARKSPKSFRIALTLGPIRSPSGARATKPTWRSCQPSQKRSLLVSLADKVHNAEAILYDYRVLGDGLWARFTGGLEGTQWYCRELAEFFVRAMPGRLSDRLSRAVAAANARRRNAHA